MTHLFLCFLYNFSFSSLGILQNSCNPRISQKQTGLTIQFAIPQKNFCSCIQKIKKKHDGGANVAYFVSLCITHSLVERLSVLTALLDNKDKSPGNIEA